MNLYIVCMDSQWIRDAQMLDTRDMIDEQMIDFDLFSDDNCWYDAEITAYIGMIAAASGTDAFRRIAGKYGFDHRTLYAIPTDVKGAETV